jgi:hypothetical protein
MEQIEQAQQTSEERFLEACCERDPAAWMRPAKLYSAYASWCEEQELRPLSITQIAPVWKRLGLRRSVVKGYPRYWGGQAPRRGRRQAQLQPLARPPAPPDRSGRCSGLRCLRCRGLAQGTSRLGSIREVSGGLRGKPWGSGCPAAGVERVARVQIRR